MGAYLSMQGQCETYLVNEDDDDSVDEKKSLDEDLLKYQSYFERFQDEFGAENSCYVIREQGEKISLMAEIVFSQHHKQFDGELSNVAMAKYERIERMKSKNNNLKLDLNISFTKKQC